MSVESRRAQFWGHCLYLNDMVRACRGVLIADDTYKFAEGRDPAELFGWVNRGLAELSRWFR